MKHVIKLTRDRTTFVVETEADKVTVNGIEFIFAKDAPETVRLPAVPGTPPRVSRAARRDAQIVETVTGRPRQAKFDDAAVSANKIACIACVRTGTGMGLPEAKRVVEEGATFHVLAELVGSFTAACRNYNLSPIYIEAA